MLLCILFSYKNEKKSNRFSTLYSFEDPFEILHADIAGIRFLAKSAVDPKYCLIFVDLFTLEIHTYSMKNRSLISKKNVFFYKDIDAKNGNRRENEITNR